MTVMMQQAVSPSPVQLDLKTKVKIRPLAGGETGGSGLHQKKDHDHHHHHHNYHHPSTTTTMSSLEAGGGMISSAVSGQYRNLTLGHIVLDTAAEGGGGGGRKVSRKVGGGLLSSSSSMVKEKKIKDRLAIWTESLAKHGQREESSSSSVVSAVTAAASSGATVSKAAVLPRLFEAATGGSGSAVAPAFSAKIGAIPDKGGEIGIQYTV
jgi:hypothetical protein